MEHVTALVDHDATTPKTCGCQRLVDAGWKVNCAACGRQEFELVGGEAGGITTLVAAYTDAVAVAEAPYPYGVDLDGFVVAESFDTLHRRDFSTDAECAETAEEMRAELARLGLARAEAETERSAA